MNNNLSHSFQSEHSPRGAEASFSMGLTGFGGGFSLEQEVIGKQDIYIGFNRNNIIKLMPYCTDPSDMFNTGMGEFISIGDKETIHNIKIKLISENDIERNYSYATDTWKTDDITYTITTPVSGIPDPEISGISELKDVLTPGLISRLTFDNTNSQQDMTGFFAIGDMGNFCFLEDITGNEFSGIESLNGYGFAVTKDKGINSFSDFGIIEAFRRLKPLKIRQSGLAGIMVEVPAGVSRTIDIALGWFRSGNVTLGKKCSYYYTNFYDDLTSVLDYVLKNGNRWLETAYREDNYLRVSGLNKYQQFLIAKSIRSYYGSTQLLQEGKRYRWVVNEGSCNMINTLDLTVDMAFYEMKQHPWLLKNVLNTYVSEYSYYDTIHFPDDDEKYYFGGISFTHDQGIRNAFTPMGLSHYELPDVNGCFSYMTHEELLNWLLSAALYYKATEDIEWLHSKISIFIDILISMQNRDNPDPVKRNGIMNLDSSCCGSESEITTYDSLDASLGQARRNTYMGMKCWAGYLALSWIFEEDDAILWQKNIISAKDSAMLAAKTILTSYNDELGYIPAILENDDKSAIIPIIEPLVYPYVMGLESATSEEGVYGDLIKILRKHLTNVLKPGICLFPDYGWKLTCNNDNSWMSKIFICQYVASKILNIDFGEDGEKYDKAHDNWWRVGCRKHSVIDQVISGTAVGMGSKYPRTASAFLWLLL